MKKLFTLLCLCFLINTSLNAQATPPRLIADAYCSFGTTPVTSSIKYYLDSTQDIYTATNSYSKRKGWLPDTTVIWTNGSSTYTGYHIQGRTIYKYDDSGNQISYLGQNYNYSVGYWYNSSMDSMAYDAHNNLIYSKYGIWDTTTGALQNPQLYTYTYSASNKMLSMIGQNWDNTLGSWVNNYRYVASYSASDDLLTDSSMLWNNVTNTWGGGSSTFQHFIYASPHHLLKDTLYSWSVSNNAWLPEFAEDSISYNASGKQTYIRYHDFDTLSMTWNEVEIYKSVYDASGYEVSDTSWVMSAPYVLRTYINDASGNILVYTTSYWSNATSSWQDSFQYSHTYDAHGNILVNQYKLKVGKGLVNQNKNVATYNSYNEMLTNNDYIWDTTTAAWLHYTLDQYYYDSLLDVNTLRAPIYGLSLYPVPATSTLNIDLKWAQPQVGRLAIYDVTGRLYRQWQTADVSVYHGSIPVADLPVGNYILVAKSVTGKTTASFTVRH